LVCRDLRASVDFIASFLDQLLQLLKIEWLGSTKLAVFLLSCSQLALLLELDQALELIGKSQVDEDRGICSWGVVLYERVSIYSRQAIRSKYRVILDRSHDERLYREDR
jgi:hypothetical protein